MKHSLLTRPALYIISNYNMNIYIYIYIFCTNNHDFCSKYVYILDEKKKIKPYVLYEKIKLREPPLIDIHTLDIVTTYINAYVNISC